MAPDAVGDQGMFARPQAVEQDRQGPPTRHRNAQNTRKQLLEAARRRFAHEGYTATTVRDIADDVGVDAALVSRYFGSKEKLFEACLDEAVHDLRGDTSEANELRQMVQAIIRNTIGADSEDASRQALLMLMRSSGNKRVDEKRADVLRNFGIKIASVAGLAIDQAGDEILLRAQLVIAVGVGMAVLRSSGQVEPLKSATEEQLSAPLFELVTALLGPRDATPGR
jgi:AcrR family transcriptional regulator